MKNRIPGREKEVVRLIDILENNLSINLCITAPYGAGKTYFVHMVMNKLKKDEKIGFIKFNAWQYDYWDNPMEALLDSISPPFLQKEDEKTISNFSKLQEKSVFLYKPIARIMGGLKKVAPSAIGRGLSYVTAIFAASHGILLTPERIKIINDFTREFSSGIIEKPTNETTSSTASGEELEYGSTLKKLIEQFRIALNNYLKDYDKFYIFIDELDRCRPDFTISLLELIKHVVFNKEELDEKSDSATSLNKISYIFTLDKRQLIESVKHAYGQGIDADGYLRRFFSLSYPLIQTHDKEELCAEWISQYPKLELLSSIIINCCNYTQLEPRNIEKLIYILNSAIVIENKLFDFNQDHDGSSTPIFKNNGQINLWYLRFMYIFLVALKLKKLEDYKLLTNLELIADASGKDNIIRKIHPKLRYYILDDELLTNFYTFLYKSFYELSQEFNIRHVGKELNDYFHNTHLVDDTVPYFIKYIKLSIDNLDFF